MVDVGDVVSKAKCFVVNLTGAPSSSLVLEAVKTEKASYVIQFKEVAGFGEKIYGYYIIEAHREQCRIIGFGKSGPEKRSLKIKPIEQPKQVFQSSFEIYKDSAYKFRFRLTTSNGQIMASSKAYESLEGCQNGIETFKNNAPRAVAS